MSFEMFYGFPVQISYAKKTAPCYNGFTVFGRPFCAYRYRGPQCPETVTTLAVTGVNDKEEEMEEEAAWIAALEARTGKKIPLHVTRFFPHYRMTDREATPAAHVYRLAETAGKYLDHVFVGNC